MLEVNYKRIEKVIIIIMVVGIIAMFQPWFESLLKLFEPLAPEADLARIYRREVAPVVLRYGFYAAFLGTVAFIVLSHYRPEDLPRAFAEKGKALTILLVALPVIYGFSVLFNLAWAYFGATALGVINFVCAIAVWGWKRWGLMGLGVSAVVGLGLALAGLASVSVSGFSFLLAIVLIILIWPKRALLT